MCRLACPLSTRIRGAWLHRFHSNADKIEIPALSSLHLQVQQGETRRAQITDSWMLMAGWGHFAEAAQERHCLGQAH